jgi:Malate/L-lactate dehydrogenases
MSQAEIVRSGLIAILEQQGVSVEDAATTADVMLEGTLRGYASHGIERIFQMLSGFEAHTLNPRPRYQVLRETESLVILDADSGLGQPAGVEAVHRAVQKAQKTGVGIAGVLNSGHLGILAYYTEIGARANCLTLGMSTTSPAVAAPGGSRPILGTNPLAYSFPGKDGNIITADYSTSAATRSVILDYKEREEPLPPGIGVDPRGQPSCDPAQVLQGGILPNGGNLKGFFNGLLVATLAGPLIGGPGNQKITGTRTMEKSPTKGDFFLCLDISQFTSLDAFQQENEILLQTIQENAPEFHVPGQGSQARKHEQLRSGFPVSERLWQLILQKRDPEPTEIEKGS